MTVKEAHERLHEAGILVNIQTLRRWIRKGDLQAKKTRNRKAGYNVDSEDLEIFINSYLGKHLLQHITGLKALNQELSNTISEQQKMINYLKCKNQESKDELELPTETYRHANRKLFEVWEELKTIINLFEKAKEEYQSKITDCSSGQANIEQIIKTMDYYVSLQAPFLEIWERSLTENLNVQPIKQNKKIHCTIINSTTIEIDDRLYDIHNNCPIYYLQPQGGGEEEGEIKTEQCDGQFWAFSYSGKTKMLPYKIPIKIQSNYIFWNES